MPAWKSRAKSRLIRRASRAVVCASCGRGDPDCGRVPVSLRTAAGRACASWLLRGKRRSLFRGDQRLLSPPHRAAPCRTERSESHGAGGGETPWYASLFPTPAEREHPGGNASGRLAFPIRGFRPVSAGSCALCGKSLSAPCLHRRTVIDADALSRLADDVMVRQAT
jgi:hypothetical protein